MPELEDPVLQLNGEEVSPSSSDTDRPHQQPTSTDYGKRVLFYSTQDKKEKCGVLRYLGVPEFAEGLWCGIELDQPEGKNNGSIHGIRYFTCDPSYGVFVPTSKVELDMSKRVKKVSGRNPASGEPARKMGNGIGKSASAPFIQQDLTQRLTQSAIAKRKNTQPGVTNWRQPMKAFATKGISRDDIVSKQQRKAATPFRAGGMYKAVSTENIRNLRDRESAQQSKPVKKSSSERDLRSTSSKVINKTAALAKPRRPPPRATSLSDVSTDTTATTNSNGSRTSSDRSNRHSTDFSSSDRSNRHSTDFSSSDRSNRHSTDFSSSDRSNRHSADFSSSKVLQRWPLTSTPSNRDESSPDGCSSPDESDSQTSSLPSSGDSRDLSPDPLSNRMAGTPATSGKAFLCTPELAVEHKANVPSGLATQASQLVEVERSSQTLKDCRVQSPDSGVSKSRYHNRPSGTATLEHPLIHATNAPDDGGHLVNGSFSLVDPSHSLEEGVSVLQVMDLFKEQYKQWHKTQVVLEGKVEQLERELQETRQAHRQEVDRLQKELQKVQTSYQTKVVQQEALHRAEVQQAASNHQQELIALHKAHRHAMEEQQREFEQQRMKHTTV